MMLTTQKIQNTKYTNFCVCVFVQLAQNIFLGMGLELWMELRLGCNYTKYTKHKIHKFLSCGVFCVISH